MIGIARRRQARGLGIMVAVLIPTLLAATALSDSHAAPRFQHSSPAQSVIKWNAGSSDEMGLPGCLVIEGRPVVHTGCAPCPPIWLGGPGMACRDMATTLTPSRPISLYPGGPALFQEDMMAAGRPVLPVGLQGR